MFDVRRLLKKSLLVQSGVLTGLTSDVTDRRTGRQTYRIAVT